MNKKTSLNKLFLTALVTILALFLSSCDFQKIIQNEYNNASAPEEVSAQIAPVNEITIGCDNSEALNPVTFKKEINFYILPLLFDGLLKIDENFMAMPNLAQSFTQTGNVFSVILKSDAKFSDGSLVTARDVEYSVSKLKEGSVYRQKVENVSSVIVKNDKSFDIVLTSGDSMFVYSMDFPIFKSQTDSNNLPIGSGRYVYNKDGTQEWLSLNSNNPQAEEIEISKINLSPLPDNEAVLYSVKTGQIDYSFAKSAQIGGYSSASGYSQCPTNNLIFLGTNNTKAPLSQLPVRQALFNGIKRTELYSSGFSGFGVSTFFPFNPGYNEYVKTAFDVSGYTLDNAAALLDAAGYESSANEDKKYLYKNGTRLELRLVVNNESSYKILAARMIKKHLEAIGVFVEVQEVPFDTFKSKIASGDFDLYLGEVEIPENMNLNCFFTSNDIIKNSADYSGLNSTYAEFKAGKIDLDKFFSEFYNQLPFVPLIFTKDIVIYSRDINFDFHPSISDIFCNINKWKNQSA